MSYDFHLFSPRADEDPLSTAHLVLEEEDLQLTQPDPTRQAYKHRVVAALIGANPNLRPFQFQYDEIAKIEGISAEEAKLRYRHIELNGPEQGNGIQIQLYDNQASVTVPYWHDGAQAEAVFKEIWNYLQIIQKETGYVIYDPQLDTILDLSQGHMQALSAYTNTRHSLATEKPHTIKDGKKRKHWWQFWNK